jgi:hypothetical protein
MVDAMDKTKPKTQQATTMVGRVMRRPMAFGFYGSFFIQTKDGTKYLIAPSRAIAGDVMKHLVEDDKVTLTTISVVKPETMIYAHEISFRTFSLSTQPPR